MQSPYAHMILDFGQFGSQIFDDLRSAAMFARILTAICAVAHHPKR